MIECAGMQIVSIQHVAARESRRAALPGTAVTTEFSKDDQLDVLSRYAQQLGCGELLQELEVKERIEATAKVQLKEISNIFRMSACLFSRTIRISDG